MIDLLALRLKDAVKVLENQGLTWEVQCSEPAYRRHDELVGEPVEYVVRQQLLTANKMFLTTVIKYRKEVL